MGKMKNRALPILEELANRPGTRMQIFDRCQHITENWEQFKRLWSWMRFQGMLESHDPVTCSHTLTPQARELVAESKQP
jgi:hypothetical protein